MSDSGLMQRRELLRRAAWILGGAISAPAALAILQGCSAREESAAFTPKFFKGAEADVVTAIADVMIPRTTTSGALDAGVPAFIDSVLQAVYPVDAQERFHAGFDQFQAAAGAGGKAFLEQDTAARAATVRQALETALSGEQNPRPFILMVRELTLLGYFSSQVGITENMDYVPVPGAFHGCVPVSQMKKPVYWE
jgi:hypothetical protein